MGGFISLSIPLFYHLVLREVEARVTEDLWEDSQAFTTFLEQEEVNLDSLTNARLKDLFENFLYYRLPEDDTFLITIIDEKFSRSSPRALPEPIGLNSNLMQQWKTLKQPENGLQRNQDQEIGNILYLAQPIKA
jgi:hypothetical protein